MSRPKPNVLASYDKARKSYEVIAAKDVFAVCYEGKPISMRIIDNYTDQPPKYKRTFFPNSGHARRLAAQLNEAMSSTSFTVRVID